MFKKNTNKIKEPLVDRVLDVITTIILLAIIVVVGYPVLYTLSCSFSSAAALKANRVFLLPVGFTFSGFEFVFNYKRVWLGFRNSVFYTFTSVLVTMFLQILLAYAISKPKYSGKKFMTTIMLICMLVSAGLIPVYLVKSWLGMVNTVWAVILAGVVSASNCFILRTAFRSSVPAELYDAAYIDGAHEFQVLWKIAIPLCKATISVITLYSIVGTWNDYFNAMIYLALKHELHPLALVLRNILCTTEGFSGQEMNSKMQQMANEGLEQCKYCLIVVSTVPVLAAYGFVQKFFQKGVMIGSVKG